MKQLAASVGEAREREGLDIDGALTPAGVTDELLDLIARVGPYGQGNPSPRFAFPATNVKFAKIVGENHVRCVLQSADGTKLEGIAFRAAGEPLGELAAERRGHAAARRRQRQALLVQRPRAHRGPHRGCGRSAPPGLSAGLRRDAIYGALGVACAGRETPLYGWPCRSLRLSVRTRDFQS